MLRTELLDPILRTLCNEPKLRQDAIDPTEKMDPSEKMDQRDTKAHEEDTKAHEEDTLVAMTRRKVVLSIQHDLYLKVIVLSFKLTYPAFPKQNKCQFSPRLPVFQLLRDIFAGKILVSFLE